MVLGKNIAHDMKSGAEGAHFFGALLLTFSFDKHSNSLNGIAFNLIVVALFDGKTKQDHLSYGRIFYSQG